MVLAVTFFVALGFTALSVVATMRAGRRGDRRSHLRRALLTVALFFASVVLALLLGQVRDFPDPAMAIHKVFARTSGLLVLAVVFTGIMLWRRPGWRAVHRACVYALAVVMVVAIVTGTWAFSQSTPKN
jgi:hypothetical protein